ncbi:mCG147438, partial [Mus musculus]
MMTSQSSPMVPNLIVPNAADPHHKAISLLL